MTIFLTFRILFSSQPLAFLEDKSYLESDTEYSKHSHSITTQSSDIQIFRTKLLFPLLPGGTICPTHDQGFKLANPFWKFRPLFIW